MHKCFGWNSGITGEPPVTGVGVSVVVFIPLKAGLGDFLTRKCQQFCRATTSWFDVVAHCPSGFLGLSLPKAHPVEASPERDHSIPGSPGCCHRQKRQPGAAGQAAGQVGDGPVDVHLQ